MRNAKQGNDLNIVWLVPDDLGMHVVAFKLIRDRSFFMRDGEGGGGEGGGGVWEAPFKNRITPPPLAYTFFHMAPFSL